MSRLDQPPASDPLSMFLGFFEERFRRYDFYLGMVHARRALDTARGHEAVHGDLDAAVPLEERVDVSGPGWRPYHCLRAIFDGVGDADALFGPDVTIKRIRRAKKDVISNYEELRKVLVANDLTALLDDH